MIVAQFYDPVAEKVVKRAPATPAVIDGLVAHVLAVSSDRGHPALELVRDDGSTTSLGTDGVRAVVVWVNSIAESFHSIGAGESRTLAFDFMGSWSEVPGDWTVPLVEAVECLRRFVEIGSPETDRVPLVPD